MTSRRDDEYGRARRSGSELAENEERDHTEPGPWPGRRTVTSTLVGPGPIARQADGGELSPSAGDLLAAAAGSPGRALPDHLRGRLQRSLKSDLSSVQLHTGSASQAAAKSVGAAAYTIGQDIHFGPGQFAPDSAAGEALIAHETAHTVQQRGVPEVRQDRLEVSAPGDAHELEAEAFARSFAAGGQAAVTPVAPGTVSRKVIARATPDAAPTPAPDGAGPDAGGDGQPASFVPQLSVTVSDPAPLVNSQVQVFGTVGNATDLPSGQQLTWQTYSEPTSELEMGPPTPATGPNATWTHKVLRPGPKTLSQGVSVDSPLGGGGEGPRADVSLNTPEPAVQWVISVEPGNTGAGHARSPNRLFRNDTLVFSGAISNLDTPFAADLHTLYASALMPDMTKQLSGSSMTLRFKMPLAGQGSVKASLRVGSMEQEFGEVVQDVKVVMDLEDLKARCNAAGTLLNARFQDAAGHLEGAASAFEDATKEQKAAIADARATQQLVADLVTTAFFTAIGGAAGASLGAYLKDVKKVANEVTDAAKDTLKFSIKTLQKLGGSSSSPGGAAGGVSFDGGGADPVRWARGLSTQLHSECARAFNSLADVLIAATNADKDAEFEEDVDPVDAIESDETLNKLMEVSTDKTDYLRELWHSWLENYAYQVVTDKDSLSLGRTSHVDGNVSDKMRAKINAAAAQCGESGDDWIAKYGGRSHDRAQAELDQIYPPAQPEPEPPPRPGTQGGGGAPSQ